MVGYSALKKTKSATVFFDGLNVVAIDSNGGYIDHGVGWVDDSIVIQSAIDYVGALGGGDVFISPGTYIISTTLYLPQYTNLEGENGGTFLYAANGLDDNVITISGSQGIVISNLWIDGNGAMQASGDGIDITHGTHTLAMVRIHDVYIYGCKDYGVDISSNSDYVNIYDCEIIQSEAGQINDQTIASNIHDVYGYTPVGSIRDTISNILEVMGDVRALIPCTDTTGTTLTDFSNKGHDGVSALDVRNTLTYQGKAYAHYLSSATPTRYLYILDNADFSFGDGLADNAFSVMAVFDRMAVVHLACNLISKRDDTLGLNEWWVEIAAGSPSAMTFECYDESINEYINVVSNAIDWDLTPNDEWNVMIATYDGSSSELGLTIYLNGVDVSNTRNNSGAYIAMENLAGDVGLGCCFDNGAVSSIHTGPITWFGITGKELNAAEVWSVTQRIFGLLGV
jgi:hypothetical protein